MRRLFILTVIFAVTLCSCARQNVTAGHVVSQAIIEIENLPPGTVYVSDSSADEEVRLSSELADSLFGDGEFSEILRESYEYAVFLPSGMYSCELGVFFCNNSSEADDLALMCCRRTDLIRRSINQGQYGSEEISTSVTVVYAGGIRAVIEAVGKDPDGMIKAVKQAMRNG